ncbi:ketopantoate reductase family protein [Flavobacterium sp.]|uniref:ketopantoate reductase family protein n=1 Tax=Flavobacterium sp. TaxID=239 RepID=UPI0040471C6A
MNTKNTIIIGTGGVGGYFGFKINEANTNSHYHITFLARQTTYKIIKEKGLTLLSPEHEKNVTFPDAIIEKCSEISNPDLILICIKEYDLENICTQLLSVINEKTVLLPLMNGADIYERIRKIIPKNTILPACVYVASHIKEKGVVEHKGITGKIVLGKDPNHPQEDIQWVVSLLKNSGATIDFQEEAFSAIWTKFMFIASFGLVTARYNRPIGDVCQDELLIQRATAIMQEIEAIAKMKNIPLAKDVIATTFAKAKTFPPSTPTSLQLDVNSKKENNELNLFAGAIINYGETHNINTQHTQKIYAEIIAKL